ncbi:hypothetical protein [Paraburkholderia haematera]|uniref:Tail assembly chaperone n=1 Tax=Paraburkholderia haematera TaxID=2793077 RepID=A0ABN7M079_9BURK|nr:hypothetical protein [Paraburkholderia haematera]CAE6770092.1 hypothetical protein R69888_03817 [Paraburkholderia haematera]
MNTASIAANPIQAKRRTREEIIQAVEEAVPDASAQSKKALIDDLVAQDADDTAVENGSAGRAGLKSGNVSELTSIITLKPGGAARLRRIFAMVRGNFSGANRVATLHDMRFIFLENDTKLLFATTYDGDWDTYIGDFATKIPELMDLLFGSVEGWPGIKSPDVKDFIISKQITAAGWYVANPKQSVVDVKRNAKIAETLDTFLDEFGKIA